jgi:hypothetical protein
MTSPVDPWAHVRDHAAEGGLYATCITQLCDHVNKESQSTADCIIDLRRSVQLLVDALGNAAERLKALEANATCPHIVTSDEGTSYCSLAEQTANSKPTPNSRQIRSSSADGLMQAVSAAICTIADCGDTPANWAPEARAAILAVAGWLGHRKPGALQWAALLREEVEHG